MLYCCINPIIWANSGSWDMSKTENMSQEIFLILSPLVPHSIQILVSTTFHFLWNKIVHFVIEMLHKENFKSSNLRNVSLEKQLFRKKWNYFIKQKYLAENIEEWKHYPRWHLSGQSRQWKHQNNVWNLFKVDNRDIRTTSVTSFWCLCC